jgi:DNA topoisomerase-3
MIVKRFVSIFFPPAVYEKYQLKFLIKGETFVLSQKVLAEPGYLTIFAPKASQATAQEQSLKEDADKTDKEGKKSEENLNSIQNFMKALPALKKNGVYPVKDFQIKEGETSPPKRYTSGSMILAMENAGQLIEDEELRAQIKGSGIGTSATRAEILKKLVSIGYLNLNQKTQVITPALLGELIYEVVNVSIVHLLNPELTASWEKGLTYVTEGTITQQEYMEKLEGFINRRTYAVLRNNQQTALQQQFQQVKACYKEPVQKKAKTAKKKKAVAGKKE